MQSLIYGIWDSVLVFLEARRGIGCPGVGAAGSFEKPDHVFWEANLDPLEERYTLLTAEQLYLHKETSFRSLLNPACS